MKIEDGEKYKLKLIEISKSDAKKFMELRKSNTLDFKHLWT